MSSNPVPPNMVVFGVSVTGGGMHRVDPGSLIFDHEGWLRFTVRGKWVICNVDHVVSLFEALEPLPRVTPSDPLPRALPSDIVPRTV